METKQESSQNTHSLQGWFPSQKCAHVNLFQTFKVDGRVGVHESLRHLCLIKLIEENSFVELHPRIKGRVQVLHQPYF